MVARAIDVEQVQRVIACMQEICDPVSVKEATEALKPCHIQSAPFLDPVTSAVAWLRNGGKAKIRIRAKNPTQDTVSDINWTKVIVKSLDGKSAVLDVQLHESIDSLKSKIQDKGIMHKSQQHLIFEGRPVDGGSIFDYCIHQQHRHKTSSTILVLNTCEINVGVTVVIRVGLYKGQTGEVVRFKRACKAPEMVDVRLVI